MNGKVGWKRVECGHSSTEFTGEECWCTQRLKVVGGWLYRDLKAGENEYAMGLVFVPEVPK